MSENILNKFRSWNILVAGLGGTGSNLVPHLCQLAYSLKKREDISLILADGDIVESDNIGRQFFVEPEIGELKAPTLQKRYMNAWNIDIAYHDNYLEDPEIIRKLLNKKGEEYSTTLMMPVLVGCVDNHYSRRIFHQVFDEFEDSLIYLDAGNGEFAGQVVMAVKINGKILLPPLGHYDPSIYTENDDIERGGTCSRNTVKQPQNMAANLWAAANLFGFLNNIISLKQVPQYMTTFNGFNMVNRPEYMNLKKEKEAV